MPCDHCGGRSRIKRACYTHHRAVEVRYLCGPCRGEPRIAPTVAEMEAFQPSRKRRSKSLWDAVAHLLGAESDADVAARAGVTRSSVAYQRIKRGIPRLDPRAVTND